MINGKVDLKAFAMSDVIVMAMSTENIPSGVGVRVAVAVVAELVLGVVLEGVNAGRGFDGSFRGGDGGRLGVPLVFYILNLIQFLQCYP